MANPSPILPGSTVGVLGSGQLGRMFAIAARQMGYRVHTFSPDSDTPTGQVADKEIVAAYDDLDAVRDFARNVQVVTFEFENVPFATATAAAEIVPVRPGGLVLHTTQHRLREKTALAKAGFPVTPFRAVRTIADLHTAIAELGLPAVLKTASFGYDGKGQVKLKTAAEGEAAIAASPGTEWIYEAFINFEKEVSVVAARGVDGSFRQWGVIENRHANHILDLSISPAVLGPQAQHDALNIARGVCEELDVVGVLCVEYFVAANGKLMINELAPRPHNSGHLTIDNSVTSQFEQQLRAVCGLPLGDTTRHSCAAMSNLLGDIWQDGEPDWAAACAIPGVKLHLYGKAEPRKGRKMGHLTALGDTPQEAAKKAIAAREAL
ncbi:5-(carboxyamino)imidazole ribonucleotide synthase [Humisphaera borealis]|uniref:N5-carboxyaminoimidazole ribonucleotide synthase n=1 Tax=Humisphaera borealis TaxID=2807512 RepID=A0A7M2WXL7_9BACT|nr:5-(carboxyamino)imidazole ribonucleotide synthase [Humisphaera borealis]QOV89952.1 5-(carboxyamino)imidazole ribonucleotide synthase [Humisphaera borealis]